MSVVDVDIPLSQGPEVSKMNTSQKAQSEWCLVGIAFSLQHIHSPPNRVFSLMMFALKFHLPPSQTGILWNKASFVECLAHANGGPWSTPMWLLTSACIERFLSTSFTKLSQIESHIWTQADHLSPCLKEDHDEESVWSRRRETSTALSSLSTALSSQTSLFRCCAWRLKNDR